MSTNIMFKNYNFVTYDKYTLYKGGFMTKFVLVRHGEPTYNEVIDLGFKSFGMAFAPLNEKGVNEVLKVCKNDIFDGSDFLISSPYTRAMQTASIIGMKYNLLVNVEVLLHEWIVDTNLNYKNSKGFSKNMKLAKNEWKEYLKNSDFNFSTCTESLLSVRNRALSVLEKYCDYDKVIVVTHGLLISMLSNENLKLQTGQFTIIESDYLEKEFDFNSKKLIKTK